ncbi:MAG: class I SAM-dependent methyltransferase [Bacteroidota bacterium]
MDFKSWLLSRYKADARARNQDVLREFLDRLPSKEKLDIIDLGAGMGSNFRYLHQQIDQDQHWTLIDNNQELLDALPGFLSKVLGQKIESGKPFHLDNKEITLDIQSMDLLDTSSGKISADVIVSNAVFDLFSKEQFDQLVQRLDTPLVYFTIHYKGTTFSPSSAADEKYLKLYDQHMQREQEFGKGMGPRCADLMADILKKCDFETFIGRSDWLLDSKDRQVQLYLIQFMEEAIAEMLQEDEIADFKRWVSGVKDRINQRELMMRVEHDDMLGFREGHPLLE